MYFLWQPYVDAASMRASHKIELWLTGKSAHIQTSAETQGVEQARQYESLKLTSYDTPKESAERIPILNNDAQEQV